MMTATIAQLLSPGDVALTGSGPLLVTWTETINVNDLRVVGFTSDCESAYVDVRWDTPVEVIQLSH